MDNFFIRVTPDTGQNNGTLSVNADMNDFCVGRRIPFKVKGGGITKSVSVEQDPNPYIYIDCGYIFSSANIQEPYEVIHNGAFTFVKFDVKFADFILSSNHQFIIKNLSTLQVEVNNPVISSMNIISDNSSANIITLNKFTTILVPNSVPKGTILSIIDITPDKLNEIVATINSMYNASTSGILISIFIKTTGTQNNLGIRINVI